MFRFFGDFSGKFCLFDIFQNARIFLECVPVISIQFNFVLIYIFISFPFGLKTDTWPQFEAIGRHNQEQAQEGPENEAAEM